MSATRYDVPPHVVLTLRGERALGFVHDVCAQDVASLGPGEGAHAAFLDPKGRILADAYVLAGENEVLLVAEEACTAGLQRAVMKPAPLAGVEAQISPLDASHVLGSLEAQGVPEREHQWARLDGGLVVRTVWGGDGYLVLGSEEIFGTLFGATPKGEAAEAEFVRIRDGRPRFGVDVYEDTLVNETPLLDRAVAEDKGCYPGQESVARVRNLGRVRRQLAVLEGSGAAPAAGQVLTRNDHEAGRVTSAAWWAGCVVALAIVGAELQAGDDLEASGTRLTLRSG